VRNVKGAKHSSLGRVGTLEMRGRLPGYIPVQQTNIEVYAYNKGSNSGSRTVHAR
jgi:hypothetical protein